MKRFSLVFVLLGMSFVGCAEQSATSGPNLSRVVQPTDAEYESLQQQVSQMAQQNAQREAEWLRQQKKKNLSDPAQF